MSRRSPLIYPQRQVSSRLRIIVLGYLVRGPLGGLAWHHLQYLMGLAQLGHDVYFLEDSDDYPSCYNPLTNRTDTDPAYGLQFAQQTLQRVGMGDRWCYHDAHADVWHGPAAGYIREFSQSADFLLNLSGVTPLQPWMMDIPVRAFVDTDPVFTQVKHLKDPLRRAYADLHNRFFTFGENFGLPSCSIPEDGIAWQPTRQPVVMDAWPVTPGAAGGKITAVMQWNSYDDAVYQGIRYGMKSVSFPPYRDLPLRAGKIFELALGSRTRPQAELRALGWSIIDPRIPTADTQTYQRYIQQSRAEFGVAKQGYVVTRSGWFSERSTCYLASGRPVLVQETGFSDWLPTGEGVLPFTNPDQAVQAMTDLNARYDHHCRVGREIVEAYFSAPEVLTSLIDRAMAADAASSVRRVSQVDR